MSHKDAGNNMPRLLITKSGKEVIKIKSTSDTWKKEIIHGMHGFGCILLHGIYVLCP
jgi:hypothetical protein